MRRSAAFLIPVLLLLAATPAALRAAEAVSPETHARLETIQKGMRSPDKETRLKSIGELVHFSGGEDAKVEALPALREAMRDPEAEVRAVACTATGNYRAVNGTSPSVAGWKRA